MTIASKVTSTILAFFICAFVLLYCKKLKLNFIIQVLSFTHTIYPFISLLIFFSLSIILISIVIALFLRRNFNLFLSLFLISNEIILTLDTLICIKLIIVFKDF